MKLVTYNVHKCCGLDGRTDPHRIAGVLAEINADVVAVQEVFSSENGRPGQIEMIAQTLKLHVAFGCARYVMEWPYGNAILSRWPIAAFEHLDLSWKRRERRGCLRADIQTPRGRLHILNTHLGTSYFERRHQVRSLFALRQLDHGIEGPRVLVGDFNEWTRGLATRMINEKFESLDVRLHLRKVRSYPGVLPLVHLDHIYFEKPLHIERAELISTRQAKIASDHLPLVAIFSWK